MEQTTVRTPVSTRKDNEKIAKEQRREKEFVRIPQEDLL